MQQTTDQDYKSLLSEVIKKQIVILGPDITLAKARNVKGLTVSDDGTVTEITGEPQTITQNLIDQFVQLSGLIVKKTMEPLLNYHSEAAQPVVTPVIMPTLVIPTPQPVTAMPQPVAPVMPTQDIPTAEPVAPQPVMPVQPVAMPTDGQFHPDQVDAATQKIIDDALKAQKV